MELQRCFQVLELDCTASIDEVRQAYKDIVSVWHPDRFSHNPRLKQKAEGKLKEVNVAYERVIASFSSKEERKLEQKEAPHYKASAKAEAESQAGVRVEVRDKTEVAVETGTRIVLTLCSYLYGTLRRLVVTQASQVERETKAEGEAEGQDHPQQEEKS